MINNDIFISTVKSLLDELSLKRFIINHTAEYMS